MGNVGSGEELPYDEGGMEVKSAVRKLTSRKAGGDVWHTCRDGEGWRMYSGAVTEGVFDVAWKCGKPPQEWKEAIIVPTYLHEGL